MKINSKPELSAMAANTAKAIISPDLSSNATTDTSTEPHSPVGARLRAVRRAQKLSLAELARRADASVGMISQIERNLSNPSIRMLEKLRTALGVPLTVLLEDEVTAARVTGEIVRRASARPHFSVGPSGVTKELLSPHGDHDIQFMIVTIPPHSVVTEMLMGPGEKAGMVFEGELRLTIGDRHEHLGVGDSFQFNSATPHTAENPGPVAVRILWIMNTRPPLVQL